MNKAPVEQAVGDERAAFEQWLEQHMSHHFSPELDLAKYEDSGEYRYNPAADYWKAWQARAALAQPSPAQAEAERPEVVGYRSKESGMVYEQDYGLKNPEALMTVAQHERIVGAHAGAIRLLADSVARLRAECNAAQARVAEMEACGTPALLAAADYFAERAKSPSPGWVTLSAVAKELRVRADKAPVAQAQPEETPGEILAAKLIETWVTEHGKPAPWSTAVEITAVATNMPNDERDRLLALDDDVDAQAQHGVPGKYDDVLLPFLKLMEHELHANAGKGDRPSWLQMDRKTALLEIYYHLGKLQKATKDNDAAGIVEYAADVSNMSMMLVDVCGLLAAAPGKGGL
ncbi:hypothetical protein KUC42_08495 [Pseudomonas aeruginosa]|nr:hypothetical protein [Pseudomonas aeruginosa]MCV0108797.1 hypothetical protein [Pseudomonas aeruginosa]MCV0113075.1 hypothetical protein [Pseudomonas aeruginosa]